MVFIATDQIVCGMDEIFQKKKKKKVWGGQLGMERNTSFCKVYEYVTVHLAQNTVKYDDATAYTNMSML